MTEEWSFFDRLTSECDRLGLDLQELPDLAFDLGPDSEARLFSRMQSMAPGVTWHDVFPDLPKE